MVTATPTGASSASSGRLRVTSATVTPGAKSPRHITSLSVSVIRVVRNARLSPAGSTPVTKKKDTCLGRAEQDRCVADGEFKGRTREAFSEGPDRIDHPVHR